MNVFEKPHSVVSSLSWAKQTVYSVWTVWGASSELQAIRSGFSPVRLLILHTFDCRGKCDNSAQKSAYRQHCELFEIRKTNTEVPDQTKVASTG